MSKLEETKSILNSFELRNLSIEEGAGILGCSIEEIYQVLEGDEGLIEVSTRYSEDKSIKDMDKEELEYRIQCLEGLLSENTNIDRQMSKRYQELKQRLEEL